MIETGHTDEQLKKVHRLQDKLDATFPAQFQQQHVHMSDGTTFTVISWFGTADARQVASIAKGFNDDKMTFEVALTPDQIGARVDAYIKKANQLAEKAKG